MNFLWDILSIVNIGLGKLSPFQLSITVVLSLFLALLCAVTCNVYSRLWNKAYRTTLTHKVLSGVASVFTFLFVLAFVAFAFFKEAANVIVSDWQTQITTDISWKNRTFVLAYDAVKKCCGNIENFANYPHPNDGGTSIPLQNSKSQEAVAEITANEGCKHFDASHPFLSKIIWSNPQISKGELQRDVDYYFRNLGTTYPTERAIELVAKKVKENLSSQTSKVVFLSRIVLVILFILMQAVPFGLIGLASYKDLAIKTR